MMTSFVYTKMDEHAMNTFLSFSNSERPLLAQQTHSPQSTTTPTGPTQPSTSASTSTKTTPSSKPITVWTDKMNIMLCREVELLNPYQHRDRSKERGKVWDCIAENLGRHGLNVTKRSVRDRFNLIRSQVSKRNSDELKASGIAPVLTPTEEEITSIVEDVIEKDQETKSLQFEAQQKEESKIRDGVEMRKRALESFTETNKRIKGEKDGPSRKKRNTGSDAHEFLLKKLELEKETRELDFQFRREEAERKRLEDERRLEREEQQEERRRQREEREEQRRVERERREDERRRQEAETRRQEEETRRRDQLARERQMELFQQQMMQQSQMLMLMLEKQKKE